MKTRILTRAAVRCRINNYLKPGHERLVCIGKGADPLYSVANSAFAPESLTLAEWADRFGILRYDEEIEPIEEVGPVTITESTLMARIRRAVSKQGASFARKQHASGWLIITAEGQQLDAGANLAECGRKLGVLKDNESVSELQHKNKWQSANDFLRYAKKRATKPVAILTAKARINTRLSRVGASLLGGTAVDGYLAIDADNQCYKLGDTLQEVIDLLGVLYPDEYLDTKSLSIGQNARALRERKRLTAELGYSYEYFRKSVNPSIGWFIVYDQSGEVIVDKLNRDELAEFLHAEHMKGTTDDN